MGLKHYYKLLTGKLDVVNPAKIDLPHIWAVIQAWFRSILPVPRHIKEQIKWREEQIKAKSPECWKQGHCIQCGCIIKEKIKADMGCENLPYCYPEMMSKKEWFIYKITGDNRNLGIK